MQDEVELAGSAFYLYAYFWKIGALLLGAIQIVCVLHVLLKGRDLRWLMLIFFLPLIGSLIYFFNQVLPSLRYSSLGSIDLPIFQRMRIKELERQLEECDSVDNRASLAEEYAKSGRHKEALDLIKDCLIGPFKESPDLLYTYAIVQLQNGEAAGALAQLDVLDGKQWRDKQKARRLLRARALDALGRTAEADAKYQEALKGFDGEEARYRYSDFLRRAGRLDESAALAEKGIAYYRKSESLYRRTESFWFSSLKKLVSECRKQKSARV